MLSLHELQQKVIGNTFVDPITGQRYSDGSTPFNVTGYGNVFDKLFGFSENLIIVKKGTPEYQATLDQLLRNSIIYDHNSGILRTPTTNCHAGWFIAPTVDEILSVVQLFDGIIPKGSPTGKLVIGIDANTLGKNSPNLSITQAASQFNSLEMVTMDTTPEDGIGMYINDRTQGPAVALSGFPGTFVRNYWVTKQLGGQFNALNNLGLTHQNGYLVWGDDPASKANLLESEAIKYVRIPAQVYTQVAGTDFQRSKYVVNKLTHQIYSSSAAVNTYGNRGLVEDQHRVVRALLRAEYKGSIGLALILRAIDVATGKVTDFNEPINLTLVGGGVFRNPHRLVLECMRDALKEFEPYKFRYHLHDYQGTILDLSREILGIDRDNYNTLPVAPADFIAPPPVPVPGADLAMGRMMFPEHGPLYSQMRIRYFHDEAMVLENFIASGRSEDSMTPVERRALSRLSKSARLFEKDHQINPRYAVQVLQFRAHQIQFKEYAAKPLLNDNIKRDYIEALSAPTPGKVFLAFLQNGRFVVYPPMEFQYPMINYIYTSQEPSGVYNSGGVNVKYGRYMAEVPILYYINERNEKVYIIDTDLNAYMIDKFAIATKIEDNPEIIGSKRLKTSDNNYVNDFSWANKSANYRLRELIRI